MCTQHQAPLYRQWTERPFLSSGSTRCVSVALAPQVSRDAPLAAPNPARSTIGRPDRQTEVSSSSQSPVPNAYSGTRTTTGSVPGVRSVSLGLSSQAPPCPFRRLCTRATFLERVPSAVITSRAGAGVCRIQSCSSSFTSQRESIWIRHTLLIFPIPYRRLLLLFSLISSLEYTTPPSQPRGLAEKAKDAGVGARIGQRSQI